jgi:hypothetical protein
MARAAATSAWTAILALGVGSGCSSAANDHAATGTHAGGAGGTTTGTGMGGAGSTTVAQQSASVVAATVDAVAVATSGPSGGGNGGTKVGACDPPAPPGSLYARHAPLFGAAGDVSMCAYRGDVLLIVDTAAL